MDSYSQKSQALHKEARRAFQSPDNQVISLSHYVQNKRHADTYTGPITTKDYLTIVKQDGSFLQKLALSGYELMRKVPVFSPLYTSDELKRIPKKDT